MMSRSPYQQEYEGQDRHDGYDYNFNMQQLSIQDQPIFQPFIPYTGHSAFPYIYYDPYYRSNQGSPINPATQFPPWQHPASPNPGMYMARNSVPGPSSGRPSHRTQWTGPDKARERKAYHPQPPVNRSDWVMWVGNVPPNTTHEELWKFFNSPIGTQPWRGPSSIFLISRSSCAFVNLTSEEDLAMAVDYFHGKQLRPWDPRCPKLVCRVRRKDDDLRSGVGAQRGTGMHRDWVKKQECIDQEPPPEGEGRRRESIVTGAKHGSSASCASTNSSFLVRNFPMRCFILKSTSIAELEQSVQTGMWKTQRHNEPVLDQAFRTAQEVFLIFGANKSGEFFGYAKMIEPIDKERAMKYSSGSSKKKPPVEEDSRPRGGSEPPRPTYFLLPSQSRVTSTSPGEITPADECKISVAPRSATDPTKRNDYFDVSGKDNAKAEAITAPPPRERIVDSDGIVRKDTLGVTEPQDEDDGHAFHIQWIKVGSLPFNHTRHLRNPWNADREVKVSRDGTELEPGVAASLMQLWDK